MKKNLLVALCLTTAVILSACGTKNGTENILDTADNTTDNTTDSQATNEQNNEDSLADLREKTPLTAEDLDRIDKFKFPVSYTYSTYDWDSGDYIVKDQEYIYPENINHKLLLPIHENMANREVISSIMDHDKINTTVNITLENWEIYPVLYVNNPDTLEYIEASVNTPTSTTIYTFNY